MIIRRGFTGTRDGMTRPQMIAVDGYLGEIRLVNDWEDTERYEFHHGDCIGSDAQAHVIAVTGRWFTVAHPPVVTALRAWCRADVILEPKPYLDRDWDIARDTNELVATPKEFAPVPRSGTWTTIGYAVRLGKPALVILPDGTARKGREFFGARLPVPPATARH